MSVGRRIRAARLAHGLTQAQVAEVVEVDVGTVRRWESGRSRPTNSHLLVLARLLDIDLEDLA